MAAIKATIAQVGQRQDQAAMTAVWADVTSADTFVPLSLFPDYTLKTIHVSGTFGSATVILGGSYTGVTYLGLNDLQDNAISITSEGLAAVQEQTLYYKPSASGGGGSQSLTVTLLFSRSIVPRG